MPALSRKPQKTFFFWGGWSTAVLAVYLLTLYGIYQRERVAYDHKVVLAGYRLDDAEEQRRLAAEKVKLYTAATNAYLKNPGYIAAQAQVDAAVNGFPSDASLRTLKLDESRFAYGGFGAYIALLVAVLVTRRR